MRIGSYWDLGLFMVMVIALVLAETWAIWWGWNVILADALELARNINFWEAMAVCVILNIALAALV